MPVVINEFEVIPAEPRTDQPVPARNESVSSGPQISEHELLKTMERQRERFERLRAY